MRNGRVRVILKSEQFWSAAFLAGGRYNVDMSFHQEIIAEIIVAKEPKHLRTSFTIP